MSYYRDPEVCEFREAWTLFSQITPQPAGVLRDDDIDLFAASFR